MQTTTRWLFRRKEPVSAVHARPRSPRLLLIHIILPSRLSFCGFSLWIRLNRVRFVVGVQEWTDQTCGASAILWSCRRCRKRERQHSSSRLCRQQSVRFAFIPSFSSHPSEFGSCLLHTLAHHGTSYAEEGRRFHLSFNFFFDNYSWLFIIYYLVHCSRNQHQIWIASLIFDVKLPIFDEGTSQMRTKTSAFRSWRPNFYRVVIFLYSWFGILAESDATHYNLLKPLYINKTSNLVRRGFVWIVILISISNMLKYLFGIRNINSTTALLAS